MVISLQQAGFTSPSYVTAEDCGLLPHSFHQFQTRVTSRLCRFCGTFPKITLGCC